MYLIIIKLFWEYWGPVAGIWASAPEVEQFGPARTQWNPKYGCRGTVTARFALIAFVQGGKRNPNPNFLVRIFSSGVGVFHVNGWGAKSSIRPSKPGKSNFLGGISRDFAGISRGRPKSLKKKSLGSIFVPYLLLGNAWLTVLWGSFWCTQSTVEMPLKGTVWGGFPLIALIALGAFFHSTPGSAQELFQRTGAGRKKFREGANREKLTVKKLIDNEMCFFLSPFMSLTNREKSA